MGSRDKILAITKRTADLCATQALLYSSGFELITATNMATASALIRALPVRGLIICYHSWSDAERDLMVSQLHSVRIPIMRCPGCTGCEEESRKAGKLSDLTPLTNLLSIFGTAVNPN